MSVSCLGAVTDVGADLGDPFQQSNGGDSRRADVGFDVQGILQSVSVDSIPSTT
jgi:hypothetical protein